MDTLGHQTPTYTARRSALETYFDRTAVEAWARLTTDAPVSRIRATVRAGRDSMRGTLLSWLPDDLAATRILDAGCGTGLFAVEAARRGAAVLAIDLSPKLVAIAAERLPHALGAGSVQFAVGDMLESGLGAFDHVVAMDSLIYHPVPDLLRCLAALAPRVSGSILFTVAPRTPLLAAMHGVGQLFPRSDRSPAIAPIGVDGLARRIAQTPALADWRIGRTHRVSRGFYISQAMELVRR